MKLISPKQFYSICSPSEMFFLHLFIPFTIVATAEHNYAVTDGDDLLIIGFDEDEGPHSERQLTENVINARIRQEDDSVVLQCEGRATTEVSWWYYPCPAIERIHLSRDIVRKHPEYYELVTGRTAGNTSTSLRVKNLKAVSGLYRCGWQHAATTHYFIVGGKTNLGRCFATESPGALLKTIQSFIGAVEKSWETFEYILKLPRGEKGTHDYRIRFSVSGDSKHSSDAERKLGNLHAIKFDESDAVGFLG